MKRFFFFALVATAFALSACSPKNSPEPTDATADATSGASSVFNSTADAASGASPVFNPFGRTLTWTENPTGTTATGFYSSASECVALYIPATLGDKPVTEIGAGAFAGVPALESVEFPDGLAKIGPGAFAGCVALKSATFPASLTEIGSGAFAGCDALKTVAFPESARTVVEKAFEGKSVELRAIPDETPTEVEPTNEQAFEERRAGIVRVPSRRLRGRRFGSALFLDRPDGDRKRIVERVFLHHRVDFVER